MSIKLVASDLDGTLFGPDHLVGERTVTAVNALVEQGIVVAAVTGRSWFGGVERATRTGARLDWFIGSNGGHRSNLNTGELEERVTFAAEVVERLRSELGPALGSDDVGFGYEHSDGFVWTDTFLQMFPTSVDGGMRESYGAAAAPTDDDVGKIFVADPSVTTFDLLHLIKPHVPNDVHVTTSGGNFIEITPPGADKGSALARLCNQLDIAADEVIAFGDNHNDLTMLEWAGRGVAMANAVPATQAIADEITASNADFGVAAVLETLL